MPIIGRLCTRDLRTVCLGMSEAALPVNQSGPGLTLVHGWASEDRRTQGHPATVVGVDFSTSAGRVLAVEYCPFCGGKIMSFPTRVRSHTGPPAPAHAAPAAHAAPEPHHAEPARVPASRQAPESAPSTRTVPEPSPSSPSVATAPALKALREKLGLSQAELGEKLGLARSSIANYENGRAPLSQRLRKWMAKHEKKLEERT